MSEIRIPLFKVFMPDSIIGPIKRTLLSGYLAEGEKVKEFTSEVSSFIGNKNIVLVNSCTSALTIAYRTAGVRCGDEVITTPLTCVATNQAILSVGGKPIWVDVDPDTGMVDPDDIENVISNKTKAIVVLHKEGDPARLSEILEIARKYNIKVIEDAAHAFGAKYKNALIGNHGDFVCFSFQAVKHLTTGDGGALACNNISDYHEAKRMKWFGVDRDFRGESDPWRNDILNWGYKANLNDITATIGLEQMKYIDIIIEKHHNNGMEYDGEMKGIPGIKVLKRAKDNYSTFWAYTFLAEKRESLIKKLKANGIGAGQIHPRNDIYSIFSNSKRSLPNVEYFDEREVSIPCGWWVNEKDIIKISKIIRTGW